MLASVLTAWSLLGVLSLCPPAKKKLKTETGATKLTFLPGNSPGSHHSASGRPVSLVCPSLQHALLPHVRQLPHGCCFSWP